MGLRRSGKMVLGFLWRGVPGIIAAIWFVGVFAVLLRTFGLDPKVFLSPDEALNRFAAAVVAETGRPFLKLPFHDPEDMAHPRSWLSVGDVAVPTYAPVPIYFYALLLHLRSVGLYIAVTLPASAAAAFAAGTALLLPQNRRFLAVFAPAMGFPALYWLLRPWMNVSALLVCLCWAFFFWVLWHRSGKRALLAAAQLCVGAAAAVRPDCAAYVLLLSLLFSAAAKPAEWRLIFVWASVSGALALGSNLVLNHLTTGHAFRAAYQMAVDQEFGDDGSSRLMRVLGSLLFSIGIPTLEQCARQFVRYSTGIGPLPLLVFGQLALLPLLRVEGRLSRCLYAGGVFLVLIFMASRTSDYLFGSYAEPQARHSIARYWAPVYLFAALPPLVFLGRCKNLAIFWLGSALVGTLTWLGALEIYEKQPASILEQGFYTRSETRRLESLARLFPSDAIVYSKNHDKNLWSRWHVGLMAQPRPTALSMSRAVKAGLPTFIYQPNWPRRDHVRLARALRPFRIQVIKLHPRGIYRVQGIRPG